jgi:putative membrane-bound dehydrogenase-like protein
MSKPLNTGAIVVAAVALHLIAIGAQTPPPGYTPNRNAADPGPPNPTPLTVAQRLAVPIVTPALAAAAIGEVTVPEGFDVTVFATPPVYNSPTAIAAAPDGTVYVAADPNGAQSFFPHMGSIVRLRDANNDGAADEATIFVPDIDSPRGLLWYDDHLIVMAPPNISAFYDRNNDGVADEQKILIRGVGRLLTEARVDHGQNNIKAGADGWIYLALGDQGIHDATGSDGRKLQHRGGGVMRFRPDGSQMEMWAVGTRNIYGLAISPTLDVFARDNTNDGGGWNVRFHHMSGMTDHGYPSLFINFEDETIKPLADFGGGSGVGGLWIDEPGIPAKWNNAPFTIDYGRTGMYHHVVTRNGATYKIPAGADGTPDINGAGNQVFAGASNPMDADIDASSNIYLATWRGGGFTWTAQAMNRGMIYKITPRGFTAPPLPNYNQLAVAALVQELQSPSYRRRIEAQRAIQRRQMGAQAAPLLLALAADRTKPVEHRAAAIFTMRLTRGTAAFADLTTLTADPSIASVALRALGDDTLQARAPQFNVATVEGALKSTDAVVRKEAIISLARANSQRSSPAIAALMNDTDPIVVHTAVQALRSLKAIDASFAILDMPTASAQMRKGALQVLKTIYDPRVVRGLGSLLNSESNADRRVELVGALSRLANREGAWNGTWWATRPSNVGPYYDPKPWAETPAVTAALTAALNKATAAEIVALGREVQKNAASAGAAVARFLAFADTEPALIPQITAYFADADPVPAAAIPVLRGAMTNNAMTPAVRTQALVALTRTDDPASWAAMPATLQALQPAAGGGGRGGRGGAPGGPGGPGGPAGPAGFGGGAAAAPAIGTPLDAVQTSLVTAMDAAVAAQLTAVTNARTALLAESLATPRNAAAVTQKTDALAQAELALATARADVYARIQASVSKLSPAQATTLAAQQSVAVPAAPGRGGGGGGRGGGAPDNAAIARSAVLSSTKIDAQHAVFVQQAERLATDSSTAADGILLALASRKIGAEAPRVAAARSLDQGWTNPRRRLQIINAAVATRDTSRALQIADATTDADYAVAQTARNALQTLGLNADEVRAEARAPKLATMQAAAILDAIATTRGTVPRGQQLVSELGCTACHTVSAAEAPKGPFLGNIAGIMNRRQIAEAILQPNRTLAQGFATYQIDVRNGPGVVGFIVREAPDAITVRDIAGQETRVPTANIVRRTQLPTSLMPEGLTAGLTLKEFASLVDYLEGLK